MKDKKALFFVRTIIVVSLLVLTQFLSTYIPSVPILQLDLRYLIGETLFDLLIVFSAAVFGLSCACVSATAAPIISVLLSLTPTKIPAMTAVFIAGNIMFAFIVWVCFRASKGLGRINSKLLSIIGIIAGATMKLFAMQYLTEKLVITYLKPSAAVTKSLEALVTENVVVYALIGGLIALVVIPFMKNVFRSK